CWRTLSVVASSVASSFGRSRTSAPFFLATSAISSSSVETTYRSKQHDALAASIVHEMSGFPHKGLIFFLGTPLLSPRAGVIPKIIILRLSSDNGDQQKNYIRGHNHWSLINMKASAAGKPTSIPRFWARTSIPFVDRGWGNSRSSRL